MSILIHTRVASPKSASTSFTLPPQNVPQRKCACGGSAGHEGECVECQKKSDVVLFRSSPAEIAGHHFENIAVAAPSRLAVNQPGDEFEQEAERVADAIMSGSAAAVENITAGQKIQRDDAPPPPGPVTEKPKSDADKLKDALPKVIEALRARDDVKQLEESVKQMGKDFVSTTEGKAVVGTTIAGALAAIIATNKELPMKIPEIPLDFLSPGLKAQLTWKGPVRSPTDVGLTVTLDSGVSIGATCPRINKTTCEA